MASTDKNGFNKKPCCRLQSEIEGGGGGGERAVLISGAVVEKTIKS